MIRFAIVGTNWITRQFVEAAQQTGAMTLTAVYSRTLEQAQAFNKDYGVAHLFLSLEQMAASDEIDAVYLASPNALHCEQALLFYAIKACDLRKAAGLQPARSGTDDRLRARKRRGAV